MDQNVKFDKQEEACSYQSAHMFTDRFIHSLPVFHWKLKATSDA